MRTDALKGARTRARSDAPTIGYDDRADDALLRDDLPGRIGRYIVLGEVGRGGMGVVLTAYDPKLERKVALKVLQERDRSDARRIATGQERLQREARALAKLTHPNIVTVHDVDVFDGQLYMAMEFVDGQSMQTWLGQRARSWREILTVFVSAARGLAAAHAAGIVHRDFKPANVLISPGDKRVRVLDFGLAQTAETAESHSHCDDDDDDVPARAPRLTAVGRRVGTPAYMAPEQILNTEVGPQADQFAFGVSLYEALYGVPPFRGDAKAAMYDAIEGRIAPPPKDREREVPGWLSKAVFRMLAADPALRFPGMLAVIDALERRAEVRRRRKLVIAGAATLVAGSVAAAWSLGRRGGMCEEPPGSLAEAWNAARREQIADAFGKTALPYAQAAWQRAAAVIDGRAAAWTKSWHDVCEATHVRGEQSATLLDARMGCLRATQRELAATLDMLDEPDGELTEQAVTIALGLRDPASCIGFDPGQVPLVAEEERATVDAIEALLAETRARIAAAREADALATAGRAREMAASIRHTPTRIEAAVLFGTAQARAGKAADARAILAEAIAEAASAGLAATEAVAWIEYARAISREAKPQVDVPTLRVAADAALKRAGNSATLRAEFQHEIGNIHSNAGDSAAAVASLGDALRLFIGELGQQHPDVARTRSDLALALVRSRRYAEAEIQLRDALNVAEAVHGPEHPVVASICLNLANVLLEGAGEFDDAEALLERARTIRARAFGREHPRVADTLVSIGSLQRRRGEDQAAVATVEQAIAILRRSKGDRRPLAQALGTLANIHVAAGEGARALAALDQAAAIWRELVGEEHAIVGRMRARRCDAMRLAGDLEAARSECAAGLTMLAAKLTRPHRDIVDAERMAAALANDEGRREEARDLAQSSMDGSEALGDGPARRAAAFELMRAVWADPKRVSDRDRLLAELEAPSADDDPALTRRVRAWISQH